MVAFVKHNSFVQDLARGVFNLHTDTLKLALSNTSPAATDVYTAMSNELATAGGYVAGGIALTGQSATQTAGTLTLAAASPTLTASGAIATFRYALLYSVTAALKQVIGHWDYGSSIAALASGDSVSFALAGGTVLTIA